MTKQRVSLQRKFPVARGSDGVYRFRYGKRSRQHRQPARMRKATKREREARAKKSFLCSARSPPTLCIHCRRPFCFRIAVYDLGRSNQGSATCCRHRRVLESGCSVPPPMSDELVHYVPPTKGVDNVTGVRWDRGIRMPHFSLSLPLHGSPVIIDIEGSGGGTHSSSGGA